MDFKISMWINSSDRNHHFFVTVFHPGMPRTRRMYLGCSAWRVMTVLENGPHFPQGYLGFRKVTMDIYGLYTCSYLKCILIVLYVVMSLFIILYVIFVLLDTSHVLILIEDMLISIMTHHDPSIFSSELGKLYM